MSRHTGSQWIELFKAAGITREDLESDRVVVVALVYDTPIILANADERERKGFPREEENFIIFVPPTYPLQEDGKTWTDDEWREIETHFGIQNGTKEPEYLEVEDE